MKVWVIGRGYPTTKNNMLGSFELEQAKMLARAGLDVTFPVIDLRSIRHFRRFGLCCKQEDGVRIAVYNVPIGILLSRKKRGILSYSIRARLMSKLKSKFGLPDIIHVHYFSIFPYRIVEEMQCQGVKIVGTEHWTKVQKKTLEPVQLENLKEFVSKADAVCCVGSELRKSIIELTDTKKEIYIVPNVVSKVFKPIKENHAGFRFVSCGRLVPVKQFDLVVSAFIDVFQGNRDVTLTLAGSGEEYDRLQSMIVQRNVEDQVYLLGAQSRQQIAELIASSDELIVYSNLETFSVPVIEAWACGKPVIATSVTVFADNPDKRLGVMVDYENIESLKKAMKDAYEHHVDYDPAWIAKYVNTYYSEEAVSSQLVGIYTNLIN